jgi:hypothetical protein
LHGLAPQRLEVVIIADYPLILRGLAAEQTLAIEDQEQTPACRGGLPLGDVEAAVQSALLMTLPFSVPIRSEAEAGLTQGSGG